MIDFAEIGKFVATIFGAGTIGGWVSGEVSRRLATREARKQKLGGLLCDLLEIRHASIGMKEMTKTFETLIPEYKNALIVALPGILEMVANPAKLHERYESAIAELAALDPLLAFHLRSKNLVFGALTPLSKVAEQNPQGIPFTAQAFAMFGDAGTSILDESILRVAKELGKRVHRETRVILEQDSEMPELAKRILELLPNAVKAAQSVQAQTSAADAAAANKTKVKSATAAD